LEEGCPEGNELGRKIRDHWGVLLQRTEVLIIGGGITGAGIARDLACRGAEVVLVESSDFSNGATGRCHGMLHSGARYAVNDPRSAAECAAENAILKRIAGFCIEDTGGLFVGLKNDDTDYADQFLSSCKKTGVAAKEITIREALNREPMLSKEILSAFEVPDASVDPFLLTLGNIESARKANGIALNYHCVKRFEIAGESIDKVIVENLRNKSIETYKPEIVVNASGAWANEIASLANLSIRMTLDKGSMVVINGRLTNGLINRLRRPSNGDIVVPSCSSSIIGTTSVHVDSPFENKATEEEVDFLICEAARMVPDILKSRAVRAYAGIRPLCGGDQSSGREISRNFQVIDHSEQGIENFISVIGGKLTTYRLMAEKVSDIVAAKLGISGSCRTAIDPLSPTVERKNDPTIAPSFSSLIGRKTQLLSNEIIRRCTGELRGMEVVCSCEQVLRGELVYWSHHQDVKELSDLMRRTRAGMGYCQGGLCIFGLLSSMIDEPNRDPIELVARFIKEREKGIEPVLFRGQLKEEFFKDHLFNGVYHLNAYSGEDHEEDFGS
jgi:glycerol-3-phosphate dehydrogenase